MTQNQERKSRLNALDEYADRRLNCEREQAAVDRQLEVIQTRLKRQAEQAGNPDAAA